MKWKPYPKYKESGVEWLGQVPEHWSIVPLSRVTAEKCDGPFGSGLKSEHYTEDGVRVIRLQNIKSGSFDQTDKAYIEATYFDTELQRHNVQPGDLLIAGLGDENHTVGRCCVAPEGVAPAMVKADCFRFRLDTRRCVPEFIASLLTISARCDAGNLATGSTRSRIALSTMGTRATALPPGAEQSRIAGFLDRETAKIDTLIATQERLIELLQEKRQALISHAVTKGLNPDAPMKPSGVEWLGVVPAHWRVGAVKRFARLESGHTPSRLHPEYWENCTYPWFTLADVWQLRDDRVETVFETKELVSEFGLANSSARLLPAGTVMLSRTASVGFSGIMGIPMATTQDFANWVCKDDTLPAYLLCGLRAMRADFDKFKYGSTHNTIYMPDIQKLQICLPPLVEQVEVVRWIRSQTGNIDRLVEKAHQSIALMRERRTALISAAVTGKIDVRESSHA